MCVCDHSLCFRLPSSTQDTYGIHDTGLKILYKNFIICIYNSLILAPCFLALTNQKEKEIMKDKKSNGVFLAALEENFVIFCFF